MAALALQPIPLLVIAIYALVRWIRTPDRVMRGLIVRNALFAFSLSGLASLTVLHLYHIW